MSELHNSPTETAGDIDDRAVDTLAVAMKKKLAISREKGRAGWNDPTDCSEHDLVWMMLNHIRKGDITDVANFTAMIYSRGVSKEVINEVTDIWVRVQMTQDLPREI